MVPTAARHLQALSWCELCSTSLPEWHQASGMPTFEQRESSVAYILGSLRGLLIFLLCLHSRASSVWQELRSALCR